MTGMVYWLHQIDHYPIPLRIIRSIHLTIVIEPTVIVAVTQWEEKSPSQHELEYDVIRERHGRQPKVLAIFHYHVCLAKYLFTVRYN